MIPSPHPPSRHSLRWYPYLPSSHYPMLSSPQRSPFLIILTYPCPILIIILLCVMSLFYCFNYIHMDPKSLPHQLLQDPSFTLLKTLHQVPKVYPINSYKTTRLPSFKFCEIISFPHSSHVSIFFIIIYNYVAWRGICA